MATGNSWLCLEVAVQRTLTLVTGVVARGQCTFQSVEAVTRSLDQWDPQTGASAGSSTRSECDTAWSSAHRELRGTVCVFKRWRATETSL